MGEGFITRRGGAGGEQTLAPTITEVSTTETSITFTITNNDDETAIIRHRLDDITDEGEIVELAAGATSSNIEIIELQDGTVFNFFATANVTGKVKSNVTEKQISTVTVPAPTITLVTQNTTSIVFTLTNNSIQTKNVVYGLTTPPATTTISLASGETSSNQTFSGLTDTTDFTIFAQAENGFIAEKQIQTLIPTPTITQVSTTETSITFTVSNNSRVEADVVYDLVTPPADISLQLAANTTSTNQTIGGLTENTVFTVFAQAKVVGFADSAVASSTVVTDDPRVFIEATGGTTQEYDDGDKRFRSHTFTSNGSFVVSTVGDNEDDRNKVDYLIIAGGGAGGSSQSGVIHRRGGGGGAGGYLTTNGTSGRNTSARPKVTVTQTTFGVVIGGGAASTLLGSRVTRGGTSSVFNINTVGGGTGGDSSDSFSNQHKGSSGGSGGGGGSDKNGHSGGNGTANQGFNGAAGVANVSAGGGGGAGSAGGQTGGGSGLANILRTGSNQTRGRGGKGIAGPSSGLVNGANGGGATGNGGNGSKLGGRPGSGGSGIVVIRYEIFQPSI